MTLFLLIYDVWFNVIMISIWAKFSCFLLVPVYLKNFCSSYPLWWKDIMCPSKLFVWAWVGNTFCMLLLSHHSCVINVEHTSTHSWDSRASVLGGYSTCSHTHWARAVSLPRLKSPNILPCLSEFTFSKMRIRCFLKFLSPNYLPSY